MPFCIQPHSSSNENIPEMDEIKQKMNENDKSKAIAISHSNQSINQSKERVLGGRR